MIAVTDYVDRSLLEADVPRHIPFAVSSTIFRKYIAQNLTSTVLDPMLIICLVAGVAIALLQAHWLLWFALICIFGYRLTMICWRAWKHVREGFQLLQHGRVVRAHILKVRPYQDPQSQTPGAYLDCAIPAAKRRTSIGSVWLPNPQEAQRLKQQGHVQVICLAQAPGTWLLLEASSPDVRYYAPETSSLSPELNNGHLM